MIILLDRNNLDQTNFKLILNNCLELSIKIIVFEKQIEIIQFLSYLF